MKIMNNSLSSKAYKLTKYFSQPSLAGIKTSIKN